MDKNTSWKPPFYSARQNKLSLPGESLVAGWGWVRGRATPSTVSSWAREALGCPCSHMLMPLSHSAPERFHRLMCLEALTVENTTVLASCSPILLPSLIPGCNLFGEYTTYSFDSPLAQWSPGLVIFPLPFLIAPLELSCCTQFLLGGFRAKSLF